MKKFISAALVCLLGLSLSVGAFAADRTVIEVPKDTPTIDGEIDDAEWNRDNYIVMDSSNCQAWAGEIADQVTFYYYWDDNGIYCAAKVVDTDVNLCADGDSPYGLDCFQIALNPNGLIADDQQGIFFSMGVTDTGNVEVQRHNYQDGHITDKCTGKGKTTADGWQMEVLIPWSEVKVLDTDFTVEEGLSMTAIICLLDRDDGGATTNAFKTTLSDKDVGDFTVGAYALNLTLTGEFEIATVDDTAAADDTAAPVEDSAAADTAVSVEDSAAADTAVSAPAAAQTSDAMITAAVILGVAALAGVCLVSKKRG